MTRAERAADILALGEPMLEFNQTRPDARDYLQGFGGDTSNCIIAAARLSGPGGPRTGYLTRIGDDAFGRLFLDLWKTEGVSTAGVTVDPEAHTGVYFVTHGARGHEFSYLRAGSAASRMRPSTLPLDVIAQCRLLHVSGISMAISASACDTVFAAMDAAHAAGAKIAFDPNLRLKLWPMARAGALIAEAARRCDYFLPSLEDARSLSGLGEVDAVLGWCHELGPRVIALKLGADGVLVSAPEGRTRIPGHRVDHVDATGAGDCFDGAFITRVVSGDTPVAAARYANAAAALATTGYGAVAPLPRPPDVDALLERTTA